MAMSSRSWTRRGREAGVAPAPAGRTGWARWLPALLLLATATSARAELWGDFTYSVNADTTSVTVTGYAGAGGAVDIPGIIDNKPVTAIAYGAFRTCTTMTSVTIPAGVTTIGDAAFQYCAALTGMAMPDTVTDLGRRALYPRPSRRRSLIAHGHTPTYAATPRRRARPLLAVGCPLRGGRTGVAFPPSGSGAEPYTPDRRGGVP